MKRCIDCRHYGSSQLGQTNTAACDIAVGKFKERCPVTGEWDVEGGKWRAVHMRKSEDYCGLEAKWFEQRDPTFLERMIARFKQ